MRILCLVPQPFFRIRSTPISVRNVLGAVTEAGHTVDLLCYPSGEDISIRGVSLHRIARVPGMRDARPPVSLARVPLGVLMFVRALRMCARERYDVIHAVDEAAFLAVGLRRFFGSKVIYDMDSYISGQLRHTRLSGFRPLVALIEKMEDAALRESEFVLTRCGSLSEAVRSRLESARVVQIEDAPLQASFQEDGDGAERLREQLGLRGQPVMVYTGSLEPRQGVDLLLRAARRVVKRSPDVRFVLVGGEGGALEQLKEFACSLGLAETCLFVGERPTREMPAFMTLATVLLASRTEGADTAQKIYTYMQSGKPIVATRLDSHTQVLDETCAVLVRTEPDDMAAGIMRALDEPLLSAALGREAKARVAARYSLASFKHKVRTAYQELGSAS